MTKFSIPVPMKQRNASSGVHTIGSPRTLKLVLTTPEQPVRRLNASISAWSGGWCLGAPSGCAPNNRHALQQGCQTRTTLSLSMPNKTFLFSNQRKLALALNVRDEKHVGAVFIDVEIVSHIRCAALTARTV